MKKTLKLSLGLALLFGGVLNAQQISGNISDETGPLPGASIVVKEHQLVLLLILMEIIQFLPIQVMY